MRRLGFALCSNVTKIEELIFAAMRFNNPVSGICNAEVYSKYNQVSLSSRVSVRKSVTGHWGEGGSWLMLKDRAYAAASKISSGMSKFA